MKNTVGNAGKIKTAEGARDLATLQKMFEPGAERFGISGKPLLAILDECNGTRNSKEQS